MEHIKHIIELEDVKITSIDIIHNNRTKTVLISPDVSGSGVQVDNDTLVIYGLEQAEIIPLHEIGSFQTLYDANRK